MDDLGDVVEDVQYLNAIQEEFSMPLKDWFITIENYNKYTINLLNSYDHINSETFCTRSLGLFLFLKYCEREGCSIAVCDFIMTIASFHEEFETVTNYFRLPCSLTKECY